MRYLHIVFFIIGFAGATAVSTLCSADDSYSGEYRGVLTVTKFDCGDEEEPEPFEARFEVHQNNSQVMVDFMDAFQLFGKVDDEGFFASEIFNDDEVVVILIATDVDSDSAEIRFEVEQADECDVVFTGKFHRS